MRLVFLISLIMITGIVKGQQFISDDENFYSTQEFESKQPAVAFFLSTGVTFSSVYFGRTLLENRSSKDNTIGTLLIAGGLLFGPSVGNMYAENSISTYRGIGTRLSGTGLMVVGLLGLVQTTDCFVGDCGPPNAGQIISTSMIYGGIGLFIYSSVYDFFNSAMNVVKLNRRKESISFSPTYFPDQDRLGASVKFSF